LQLSSAWSRSSSRKMHQKPRQLDCTTLKRVTAQGFTDETRVPDRLFSDPATMVADPVTMSGNSRNARFYWVSRAPGGRAEGS
jgi:hypothetical protein